MTSIRLALPIVCLLAAQPVALNAGQAPAAQQAATPATNFRIITAGGFLGYLDGLVRPAEVEGGLLGFERFLVDQTRRRDDLLLITGNNMPHEAGAFAEVWGRLAALKPDAVMLSIDDFRRALRQPHGIVSFLQALPAARDLPLVASNAIIKAKGKRLNTVSSGGLTLEIVENESIAWLTKVRVAGGNCGDGQWTLRDLTTPPIAAPTVTDCKTSGGHQQLLFSFPLRPGRRYELAQTTTPKAEHQAVFRFYTHRALVPLGETYRERAVPAELVGLPVRYATLPLEGADARVIILGFVDTDTRKRLGTDRWQWNVKQAPCDGQDCELGFLAAKDTLTAIAAAVGGAPEMRPDPVFVFMSGLFDTPMLSLMSNLPNAPGHKEPVPIAVPVVLLDPDTAILGGDAGHTSIVHGDSDPEGTVDPTSTQIWVRPPWVGARADTITGRLAWTKQRWQLMAPEATPLHVGGDVAKPQPSSPASTVTYTLSRSGTTLGPYEAYGLYSGGALTDDAVWQSLAVLLLDVMRRDAHADMAILPKHFIDEDIVKEVANETGKGPVVFSRFRLGKLLYEQESVVSADVEGGKLADVLGALVKAEAAAHEDVFIAGIGNPGALSQIDTKHLLVNGRTIVGDHFYKVALPQSVAEAQGLTIVNHDAVPSLLDAVDDHLRNRGGAVLRSDNMNEFEDRFTGRRRLYLSLNPSKFSYFRGSPTDGTLLSNIPLAGRSVKDERQWNVSGRSEVAIDGLRFAGRGIMDLRFAKNILSAPPSYPEDEWTAGARFDVKLKAGVGRVFGGPFVQSQFREQHFDDITPTRKVNGTVTTAAGHVLSGATVPGQPVHIDNQNPADPDKPAYAFARFGTDLTSWSLRPWLIAKDVAAAFDWGKAYNSRTDVALSGLGSFSISEVYHDGLSKFINNQFARNPAAFAAPQVLTFTHKDYEQRRVQMDGTLITKGQPTWPRWTRESSLSLTTQYRRYFDEDRRPDYTPNWSLEMKTQLEWTVLHRLKAGPYVNYYRVDVKLPANAQPMTKPLDYVKIGIEFNVPIFISGHPAWSFQ